MMTLKIGFASVAFFALCSIAHADAYDCKATETQAECAARLKCKPNEEVEDCQKRLRAAAANGGNNGNNGNSGNSGGDRGGGNDRGGDNDRGGNDRGGSDRGNDRGGNDRGDRYDHDDNRRSSGRGRRRGGGGGGGSFEANKTFGLGLELGEPAGLNGKWFFGPRTALDFGVGYIYRHYYYDRGEGLHLYGDVLFHPVLLTSSPALEIPLYVGPGLRFWDFRYCVGNVCDFHGSAVGIRVPVGISFDFNNVPLDIFIQLVPTIDFLSGDYYDRFHDRNHFGIDFSVGLRFWFK
ncbi:MAG TPA: hypothetical protein VL326_17450 [Kofleriaceae bacterium]|nr:hypothetical protein [Kofleriaceae bacterium]